MSALHKLFVPSFMNPKCGNGRRPFASSRDVRFDRRMNDETEEEGKRNPWIERSTERCAISRKSTLPVPIPMPVFLEETPAKSAPTQYASYKVAEVAAANEEEECEDDEYDKKRSHAAESVSANCEEPNSDSLGRIEHSPKILPHKLISHHIQAIQELPLTLKKAWLIKNLNEGSSEEGLKSLTLSTSARK